VSTVTPTRTLVILRHAKAANPDGVPDADRPLTDRGHADAAAAGAWIIHNGLVPDLVLCSPARRTRQTWHGVAVSLAVAPEVRYEEPIYGAPVRALLATVRAADEAAATVLLIGHNPGLSELSLLLDPDGADAQGLRTAGIAVHGLTGAWTDFGNGTAALRAAHTARAD
jgi:phosphohistidine phosphatase